MSKEVVDTLKVVLANTYSLYLKTQNYHWNVLGPNFKSLHLLFEEHYTDLANAVDEIAERIRALNELAPGSFAEFEKLRTVTDADSSLNAEGMVKDLYKEHEEVLNSLKKCLAAAQKVHDESTIGLVTERMAYHEKTVWMLKSSA